MGSKPVIAKRFWERADFWAGALAVMAGAPAIVSLWMPVLTARQSAFAGSLAATLAAIAAILSGNGARQSAKESHQALVDFVDENTPASVEAPLVRPLDPANDPAFKLK